MQQTYSRYRDMKREIRSSAAIDIQRLIRGFLARRVVKKMSAVSKNLRYNNSTLLTSWGNDSDLLHRPVDSTNWKSNRQAGESITCLFLKSD